MFWIAVGFIFWLFYFIAFGLVSLKSIWNWVIHQNLLKNAEKRVINIRYLCKADSPGSKSIYLR